MRWWWICLPFGIVSFIYWIWSLPIPWDDIKDSLPSMSAPRKRKRYGKVAVGWERELTKSQKEELIASAGTPAWKTTWERHMEVCRRVRPK